MTGIAILGAGAFGTALAIALSRNGTIVTLIARTDRQAGRLNQTRRNETYLPGIAFPDGLRVAAMNDEIDAQTILLAVPMQSLSSVLSDLGDKLAGRTLVACCKGVDLSTGNGATALINTAHPDAITAILTGPSFAVDVANGLPTALTLACRDSKAGTTLQSALSRDTLRLYLSQDVTGAELGGALKNVIALAAGLTIGAGLGESARASVITRGFAEMRRLSKAMGAQPDTLSGLSGLGDLVLTCTSEKSRNYAAGLLLGGGNALSEGRTIEGLATAKAVARIARDRQIDAPLTTMVAAVVGKDISVGEARSQLLARPLKSE